MEAKEIIMYMKILIPVLAGLTGYMIGFFKKEKDKSMSNKKFITHLLSSSFIFVLITYLFFYLIGRNYFDDITKVIINIITIPIVTSLPFILIFLFKKLSLKEEK